jgi:hypothetical protein
VLIDPAAGYETIPDMMKAARAMFGQALKGKSPQARANAGNLLNAYERSITDDGIESPLQLSARAIKETKGGEKDTVCLAIGSPITIGNVGRQMGGSAARVILKPNEPGKYKPAFLARLDALNFDYKRATRHELSHCLSKVKIGSTVGETEAYHVRLHETGADIASILLAVNDSGEDKAIEQARMLSILRLNKASTALPDPNHVTSWGLKRVIETGAVKQVRGKSLQGIVDFSYNIAQTVMTEIYPHLNDPTLSAAAKFEKTKQVDEQLEAEADWVKSVFYGMPHQGTKDIYFLPTTLTPQSAVRMLAFKEAISEINPYPHSRVEVGWQKLKAKFPDAVGYAEEQARREQNISNLRNTPADPAPRLYSALLSVRKPIAHARKL